MEDENVNINLLSAFVSKAAAKDLLSKFDYRLSYLASADLKQIVEVSNISFKEAKRIKAAFLLAQKLAEEKYPKRTIMDTPEKVVELLKEANRLYQVEIFQIVLLDKNLGLISVEPITKGTFGTTLAEPREVFLAAFKKQASSIILVHNHPFADAEPSEGDIETTCKLAKAGEIMRVEVVDHIIIGEDIEDNQTNYVSLRERGYFDTCAFQSSYRLHTQALT